MLMKRSVTFQRRNQLSVQKIRPTTSGSKFVASHPSLHSPFGTSHTSTASRRVANFLRVSACLSKFATPKEGFIAGRQSQECAGSTAAVPGRARRTRFVDAQSTVNRTVVTHTSVSKTLIQRYTYEAACTKNPSLNPMMTVVKT